MKLFILLVVALCISGCGEETLDSRYVSHKQINTRVVCEEGETYIYPDSGATVTDPCHEVLVFGDPVAKEKMEERKKWYNLLF